MQHLSFTAAVRLHFPWPESEKIIQQYIECLKSEPYKAVDFDQDKSMDEQGSDYVIKYAGGISIYFKKKKIGAINIHKYAKGEFIYLQSSKHPKYDNAPLILKKSNIEFGHRRKLRVIDEDKRDIGGAWGFVDFMDTEFNPKEVELTDEVIKFLINDSSEVKSVPDINKELITNLDDLSYYNYEPENYDVGRKTYNQCSPYYVLPNKDYREVWGEGSNAVIKGKWTKNNDYNDDYNLTNHNYDNYYNHIYYNEYQE